MSASISGRSSVTRIRGGSALPSGPRVAARNGALLRSGTVRNASTRTPDHLRNLVRDLKVSAATVDTSGTPEQPLRLKHPRREAGPQGHGTPPEFVATARR